MHDPHPKPCPTARSAVPSLASCSISCPTARPLSYSLSKSLPLCLPPSSIPCQLSCSIPCPISCPSLCLGVKLHRWVCLAPPQSSLVPEPIWLLASCFLLEQLNQRNNKPLAGVSPTGRQEQLADHNDHPTGGQESVQAGGFWFFPALPCAQGIFSDGKA